MIPETKTSRNALAEFKTKPFGPIKYTEGPCHKRGKLFEVEP